MRLVHYRYKPEFAATAGIEATAPETGRDLLRQRELGSRNQQPRPAVTPPPVPVLWQLCPSPLETPLPGTPLLDSWNSCLGILPSRSPAPQPWVPGTLEVRESWSRHPLLLR